MSELARVLVLPRTLEAVRDALGRHKKIEAIKTLRNDYRELHKESLGLREAKHAVERLATEQKLGGYHHTIARDALPICTTLTVKKVEVDTMSGPVWVDLEELQLRILNEVGSIGLDETGRLLEVVEVLQAWGDGKKIGVIDDV
tara:strand:- start:1068 stop:1499 length:432 start_codon:yes stop_codon:yes gene_type:complete